MSSCAICKVSSSDSKLRKCGGCGEVAYCSIEHQREHWNVHKNECKQKHKQNNTGTGGIESHLRNGDTSNEPAVTSEDQKDINKFGRLNARLQDLKDEIKIKEEDVQNMQDAVSDVELCFEENSCRVRIGEVYVSMSNEEAQAHAEKEYAIGKSELMSLKNELSAISTDMDDLKLRLKTKFGNAINLENDPRAH